MQKLNGEQALAVARTRHQDSDLKRGQRQMQLLKALFAKAQKSDSFNKLDDVIKIVGKNLYINRMGAYTIYKNQAYITPDILKINKDISVLNAAHISKGISFEVVEIDANLI